MRICTFISLLVLWPLLVEGQTNPQWNIKNCQSAPLATLAQDKWIDKKVYLEVKFRGFNNGFVNLWEAPVVCIVAPQSRQRGKLFQSFSQFNANQNIRVFGRLKFLEDSQEYKFLIFHVESSVEDDILFENRFTALKANRSPEVYREFYDLSKWAKKRSKVHSNSDGKLNAMGKKLQEYSQKALSYGLKLKDKNTADNDFKAQLQLAKDYLDLAKDKKKSMEKFITCFNLRPKSREVIEILQGFGLVRDREKGRTRWYKKDEYYAKKGLQKLKTPWGERWYTRSRYQLMKLVMKRLKATKLRSPLTPQLQRKYEKYATEKKSIQLSFHRQAVILAWGYPVEVLRFRHKNGTLYELWYYPQSRRYAFFEQLPRDKMGQVLRYGTLP